MRTLHYSLFPLFVFCLAMLPCVRAAEGAATAVPSSPVATWSLGEGVVAEAPAHPGSDIAVGQRVTSSAEKPAKIDLAAPMTGTLTLSPGSTFSFVVETIAETQELVIDLSAGAVQIDLRNKGTFAAVRVRGAALDVRVTGTLFVVERIKRDEDYIALIQGKVKVSLRKEVADALGSSGQSFELENRQGVGATVGGGLGVMASLTNRPQIASAKRKNIKEQSTGPQEGNGGWDKDLALDFLNDLLDQLGFNEALINELTDALGESLFEDMHAGPGDQVINRVFLNASSGVLGAPPPPPPFGP
jgi:hypothetical protein